MTPEERALAVLKAVHTEDLDPCHEFDLYANELFEKIAAAIREAVEFEREAVAQHVREVAEEHALDKAESIDSILFFIAEAWEDDEQQITA